MKLIFLDVDGVLNSHESMMKDYNEGHRGVIDISEPLIATLAKLVYGVEGVVEVVLSSTWRLGLHKDLERNTLFLRALYSHGIELWGVTPNLNADRGLEIKEFLDSFKGLMWIDSFVILDDDSADILPYFPNELVIVDRMVGLTDKDVEKAIAILNKV